MTQETNVWAWWQGALEGNFGPMHEGQPEQGYYRTRFKGGQWEPVALWFENGEWHAMRGERMVDPADTWNFCRTHPVSYEAYQKAIEGAGWDDDPARCRALCQRCHQQTNWNRPLVPQRTG